MPNAARCGTDTAGGLIGPPATPRTVLIGGQPIACAGDPVASHGTGTHAAATVTVTRAHTVFANGLPIVSTADFATCGDPVLSSSTVMIA